MRETRRQADSSERAPPDRERDRSAGERRQPQLLAVSGVPVFRLRTIVYRETPFWRRSANGERVLEHVLAEQYDVRQPASAELAANIVERIEAQAATAPAAELDEQYQRAAANLLRLQLRAAATARPARG